MTNSELETGIQYLAQRYADCGVTESDVRRIVNSGGNQYDGLDDRARLIGARLGLGMTFGKQELFTLDDLIHVTGASRDEVLKLMAEENVSPMTISLAPWLQQ